MMLGCSAEARRTGELIPTAEKFATIWRQPSLASPILGPISIRPIIGCWPITSIRTPLMASGHN